VVHEFMSSRSRAVTCSMRASAPSPSVRTDEDRDTELFELGCSLQLVLIIIRCEFEDFLHSNLCVLAATLSLNFSLRRLLSSAAFASFAELARTSLRCALVIIGSSGRHCRA